jgi:hypothetical protein
MRHFHLLFYYLQNLFTIPKHIIIPESQDYITLIFKPGISYFIILIIRMLSVFHFYNQLTLKTYKINNISADNRLRNLTPAFLRRKTYHRYFSASVGLFLNERAISTGIIFFNGSPSPQGGGKTAR